MRVVAGKFKSRPLVAPAGSATRPTSDRVRESLFGMLETLGMLDGAAVVDLCAGSGALGIEALSRGASRVVFVERAPKVAGVIRANVAAVGAGGLCRVLVGDATRLEQVAGLEPGGFDLVLADPPYAMSEKQVTRMLTGAQGLLKDAGSLIVLERSVRGPDPVLPEGLRVFRHRTYGETAVWLLETQYS